MPIKAIIFDLGETLLNYGKVDADELFGQGAHLTYEYLQQISGGADNLPPFKRYHRRHWLSIRWHYAISVLTRREFDCLALLEGKAQAMGLGLDERQLQELAWLWYKPLGDAATIEPELHRYLQELVDMSLKLAIISNTFLPPAVLDRQLEKFDLLRFFPVRQYSSAIGYRKPDRRIYQRALDLLGVGPAAAIMVGDKLSEDIKGPGKLGIAGVYKRGANNQQQKLSPGIPVISSIAELPELIKKCSRFNV